MVLVRLERTKRGHIEVMGLGKRLMLRVRSRKTSTEEGNGNGQESKLVRKGNWEG